jgi:hypothetical protein
VDMFDFAVIWILFFGVLAIPFTYYLCFTQAGRDLMWSLLRFNPTRRNLYGNQETHDGILKFFGFIFMAFIVLVLSAVLYRIFVPLE